MVSILDEDRRRCSSPCQTRPDAGSGTRTAEGCTSAGRKVAEEPPTLDERLEDTTDAIKLDPVLDLL